MKIIVENYGKKLLVSEKLVGEKKLLFSEKLVKKILVNIR